LGVPRSGALDQPALRLANALVGNDPSAAALETTLMGCRLRFETPATIAVTGATCTVKIDGQAISGFESKSAGETPGGSAGAAIGSAGSMVGSAGAGVESVGSVADSAGVATATWSSVVGPVSVPAGAVVEIGRATAGVRSYLAVAGGIDVEPVLGSRSTDTLSGLGPPRLTDGQILPIGITAHKPGQSSAEATARDGTGRSGALVDPRAGRAASAGADGERPVAAEPAGGRPVAAGPAGGRAEIVLGVWVGPRDEWVAVAGLFREAYEISPVSNRVACRLTGAALRRTRDGELPPEGLVLGSIQVPPDGQPLIFLADHPTTGGYPVVGVVDDVAPLAQARPGTTVRFRELDRP
jgi:allophanate hydrolase subunit 2